MHHQSADNYIAFNVNHPFAFMIFDTITTLIVMAGHYGDPTETMLVVHERQLTVGEREELLADVRKSTKGGI